MTHSGNTGLGVSGDGACVRSFLQAQTVMASANKVTRYFMLMIKFKVNDADVTIDQNVTPVVSFDHMGLGRLVLTDDDKAETTSGDVEIPNARNL